MAFSRKRRFGKKRRSDIGIKAIFFMAAFLLFWFILPTWNLDVLMWIKIIDPFKRAMSFVLLPSVEDDQRSTLWPMLVSLIIAMIGSLITTYVFLKEALDRMSDERPYYRAVIQKYRSETRQLLWWYTIIGIAVIVAVVGLYAAFYFYNLHLSTLYQRLLIVLYCSVFGCSAFILRKCINIEKGLHKTAKMLLRRKINHEKRKLSNVIVNKPFSDWNIDIDCAKAIQWLQIGRESNDYIDKKKFVARFSAWEKLMLLLLEQDSRCQNEHTQEEQLNASITNGIDIFHVHDIEDKDAMSNGWYQDTYLYIRNYEEMLSETRRTERVGEIFSFLRECRNLLLVLADMDANVDGAKKVEKDPIVTEGQWLAERFQDFVFVLSVEIIRILPKIEIFFPSGQFVFANFYGVRFENSSFRSSAFKDSVFSRSKVNNSNFSVSRFENSEFFNVDSRNCSYSNAVFDKCRFKKALFEDVDFTGADLTDCCFAKATFHNSILASLKITNIGLEENEFIDSRLENIRLDYNQTNKLPVLQNCDFSRSNLIGIQFKCDALGNNGDDSPALKAFIECFREGEDICLIQSDQKHRLDELVKRVKSYVFTKNPYAKLAKKQRAGEVQNLQVHPVWSHIGEKTVVAMNESVFHATKMPRIQFFRVNLEQSLFREAQMNEAVLIYVFMPGSIMNSVSLRGALLCAVNMQSVILADAILFKSICKVVNFEDASLRDLHASEADIQYCSFNRSDCSRVDFTRAIVKGSVFCDTILTEAELTGAVFEYDMFDASVANQMLATYTRFENCSFRNAYLGQSNFNYTIFKNCKFNLANFSNSTVTGAEFYGCDFENGDFRNTHFIQAVFHDCDNLSVEIFKGSRFIDCCFKGENEVFWKELSGDSEITTL